MRKLEIVDITGQDTGIALSKRNLFFIVIAVIIPFLVNCIPFGAEAPMAGLAVGFIISDVLLLITGVVSLGAGALLLVAFGLLTGLLTSGNILSGSLFYQFIGFCVIGYGAEATPFGARFSYWLLRLVGKKPGRIVTAFLLISSILSSFISNTAAMILMASICHQVMKQMGEEAGKSKFAAACMLACALGPNIGCAGFIQGSPGITLLCLRQISEVTVGSFTISPMQWAAGGWLTLLFILPVSAFLLQKMVSFKGEDIHVPEKEYYTAKLWELGPVKGKEKRWILYVSAMIVFLILGVDTTTLMLVLLALCLIPGVGVFSAKTAFTKAIPWEIILCGVGMCEMGTILSNSGLTGVVSKALAPALSRISPFFVMVLISVVIAVISMYTIATTYACVAIGITLTAPIIEAIGINPAIILFPTIISINYMFGLFAQPIIQHNYRYGYWDKWKISTVGTVVMIICVLVNCLVSYFLLPTVWGVPLYL